MPLRNKAMDSAWEYQRTSMTVINEGLDTLWVKRSDRTNRGVHSVMKNIWRDYRESHRSCSTRLCTSIKIFCLFARAHKNAKVFVVPGQFSFPVQLPNPLLGISNATELLDSSNPPPNGWTKSNKFWHVQSVLVAISAFRGDLFPQEVKNARDRCGGVRGRGESTRSYRKKS